VSTDVISCKVCIKKVWVGPKVGYITCYLIGLEENTHQACACFQASWNRPSEHVCSNMEHYEIPPFADIRGQCPCERVVGKTNQVKFVR
jgi:hypothetical protein